MRRTVRGDQIFLLYSSSDCGIKENREYILYWSKNQTCTMCIGRSEQRTKRFKVVRSGMGHESGVYSSTCCELARMCKSTTTRLRCRKEGLVRVGKGRAASHHLSLIGCHDQKKVLPGGLGFSFFFASLVCITLRQVEIPRRFPDR